MGFVIGFNSFVHGCGRSTLAKEVAKELGGIHLSTGDIFREIALERGFDDVKAFEEHLMKHPRLMIQTDISLDVEFYNRIREYAREGIVVIDSSVHSHPTLLYDVDNVVFYVYASPDVIRERLSKGRVAEKYTGDPLKYNLERTRKDIARYRFLSLITGGYLSFVYSYTSDTMSRLYRLYLLHMKKPHINWLKNAVKREGGIFVDNSGPLERSLEVVMDYISKKS